MPARDTTFGRMLRRYRTAAGLTQEALAERAGLSARTVSDLERGINAAPRPDTLDLLAAALALPPERRVGLIAAARPELARPEPVRPPPRTERVTWRVPVPPTPIVGRGEDVSHVARLLERGARLVTLAGAGGVGKTRLALEVAHRLRGAFADGAAFVDLSSVRDVALLPSAVLHVLSAREAGDTSPMERLNEVLANRHLLLVLDNFEQLLEGAPLLADLLSSCARLGLLVTSRAPLRLRAEHAVSVDPLPLADAAVLFADRVRAVRPDRDPTPKLAAAICERVDCLPLAIELAAVQADLWPLPAVLEQLRHRLPMLTEGPRDLPGRQRTMRDALAWSYELLSPAQQALFRALAVFAGGCTLEAARAVWSDPGHGVPDLQGDVTRSTLRALADHHLVRSEVAAGSGGPRFIMLHVVQEYARERLRAAGEEERCERRHAEYFATVAADALTNRPGQDTRDVELGADLANARVALEWALARREAALGLTLAAGFGRIWYMQGLGSEAARWLETMLALDAAGGGTAPAVRTMALYGAARHALDRGAATEAEALALEGLELARLHGDQPAMASLLAIVGQVAQQRGDLAQARARFDEAVESARRAGDVVVLSTALTTAAQVARLRGEYGRAFDLLDEAHSLVANTPGLTWGAALTLTHLGLVASAAGAHRRALGYFREALERYRTLGNRLYVAWCLEGLAAALASLGRYDAAVSACAAASALREQEGAPLPPDEREVVEGITAAARVALGDAAYEWRRRTAAAWTREDAIARAVADAPRGNCLGLCSAGEELRQHGGEHIRGDVVRLPL